MSKKFTLPATDTAVIASSTFRPGGTLVPARASRCLGIAGEPAGREGNSERRVRVACGRRSRANPRDQCGCPDRTTPCARPVRPCARRGSIHPRRIQPAGVLCRRDRPPPRVGDRTQRNNPCVAASRCRRRSANRLGVRGRHRRRRLLQRRARHQRQHLHVGRFRRPRSGNQPRTRKTACQDEGGSSERQIQGHCCTRTVHACARRGWEALRLGGRYGSIRNGLQHLQGHVNDCSVDAGRAHARRTTGALHRAGGRW